MPRQTQAIIHLNAIKANYLLANNYAPGSKNIAVIKADAYGHGCTQVAQILEPLVPAFAVALFEEAITLREAGVSKPILLFQDLNQQSELDYASKHNLWVTVTHKEQADFITKTRLNSPLKVWLKLDTGMHRLGLSETELKKVKQQLYHCDWVDKEITISSHFACASDIASAMTHQQLQQFSKLFSQQQSLDYSLEAKEQKKRLRLSASIANSAAIMAFPETHLDWNRPGIMLYGLSPFDQPHSDDYKLQAAMTLTSTVIAIRDLAVGESVGYGSLWQAKQPATIATIAVGYADGYPRQAASGTPLLIAGQTAKLAGRVSMDLISADITECSGINIGDPVELWGKTINANEVARFANTIGYDLLTGVSGRVPRIYA